MRLLLKHALVKLHHIFQLALQIVTTQKCSLEICIKSQKVTEFIFEKQSYEKVRIMEKYLRDGGVFWRQGELRV